MTPVPELAAGISIFGASAQTSPPPAIFSVASVISLSSSKPFSLRVSPIQNIIFKFLDQMKSECNLNNEKIKSFVSEFNDHLNILKKFSEWMIDKAKTEKDDVSAAANDYLKTLGYVSIAYAWIKVLEVSFKDFNENKNFYEDKIDTARFYFDKVLPRVEQHYKSGISGSSNLMNFKFN